MKILSLTIKNVGMIEDATIPFNKALLLFYGDVRNGKTTILNAVRWCFGGKYPTDIIRHTAKEASVCIVFEENGKPGSITREWYVDRSGKVSDRAIVFIRDGKQVKKPADEIAKLLNPFLLDREFFQKKSEADRKQYMVELLGVKTDDLDQQAVKVASEAKDLRAKISGYGEIDLTVVEPVDADGLRKQLFAAKGAHAQKVAGWNQELEAAHAEWDLHSDEVDKANRDIERHNMKVDAIVVEMKNIDVEIGKLERKIEAARERYTLGKEWLAANPKQDPKAKITPPDTSALRAKIATPADHSELESRISDAAANQVRRNQYLANVKRDDARKADNARLAELEKRGRELKAEKASRLKTISESSGIAGLAFDDDGNFTFQGCHAGMLSTSQIIELSTELSSKYPEGFSVDLLDRGESLGKSIFEYVKRAEAEKKTILATIVGESPAEHPDNIGVYVVEQGNVKPA